METTMPPEHVRISNQLAIATLQYLSRQPFADVRQLVGRYEQEIAESQAADERTKTPAANKDD